MSNRTDIRIDERTLNQIAFGATQYSESFNDDLRKLGDCLGALPEFWSGAAAKAYLAGLKDDFDRLEEIAVIIGEAAASLRFAMNEYEKRAERMNEIVRALQI